MLAPIALFVYNRPECVRQTLDYLSKNLLAGESDLFIFSDAPKSEADKPLVREVRQIIDNVQGFKWCIINERTEHFGLVENITRGISEIINRYGRIIVLEDDLITSEYFLTYMNEALDQYENVDKVISINGFLPSTIRVDKPFFLNGAECWGWGTWERGWKLYGNICNPVWLKLNMCHFHKRILKRLLSGEVGSWAMKWLASALQNKKLTLYPNESLIDHIGNSLSATNSNNTFKIFNAKLSTNKITLDNIPISSDSKMERAMKRFYNTIKLKQIWNIIQQNRPHPKGMSYENYMRLK